MAGAPEGNTNSNINNRLWANTIRRAVLAADASKLRAIADKLVDLAAEGDMQAIKELGDRLDGKPAQSVVVGGDQENPLKTVTRIELVPLASTSKDPE